MPQASDETADFVSRKLPAFARLGSLSHLNLDLFRMRQILGRNSEAAGGDLLDLVVQRDVNRRSFHQGLRNGYAAFGVHSRAASTRRRGERLRFLRMHLVDV